MNVATASDTKPKAVSPAEPVYAPCLNLSVVFFVNSVMLQGEIHSASITPKGASATSNAVDSIVPANVLPDGRCEPAAASERGHGLLLSKKVHNLNTGKRQVVRTFVPWHNVRSISYAE